MHVLVFFSAFGAFLLHRHTQARHFLCMALKKLSSPCDPGLGYLGYHNHVGFNTACIFQNHQKITATGYWFLKSITFCLLFLLGEQTREAPAAFCVCSGKRRQYMDLRKWWRQGNETSDTLPNEKGGSSKGLKKKEPNDDAMERGRGRKTLLFVSDNDTRAGRSFKPLGRQFESLKLESFSYENTKKSHVVESPPRACVPAVFVSPFLCVDWSVICAFVIFSQWCLLHFFHHVCVKQSKATHLLDHVSQQNSGLTHIHWHR